MKKKIFSSLLIAAVLITSLTFFTPPQSAKENSEVVNLALMLPESDVIVAIDMNKTLNVVGPDLLNQEEKKIENLKKLMKSLENIIGINPYEINQIVAGIKIPATEETNIFSNLDFTVIFRTANSNTALLENWSKKIDAIEAFNLEKEPTEKYVDAFKAFRYYKLSKDETEKISKSSKEFDEILKKTNEVKILLNEVSKTVKTTKSYKDSVKKNKVIIEAINRYQTLLKLDSDTKNFHDSSIKLQNRWYEINLEDPKRGEKLAAILKEAKAIYPNYKSKVENIAKIEALINISDFEFYEKLAKKSFGLLNIDEEVDFDKSPNEMMKEKLDEIINTLSDFSIAKQNNQLKLISKNLQKLEDAMSVRLKELDGVRKFDEISQEENLPANPTKSISKSIKENAKISEVNGKKMITIDYEKINFWSPTFGIDDENKEIQEKETEENKETSKEVKIIAPEPKNESVKTGSAAKKDEHFKHDDEKEEKKKELFAIGYLDEKTMVIGFEEGIKAILNRQTEYKNPKAAEMLNSFKNPLISFATNSKLFQNLARIFETLKPEEEKKKASPIEKFFNDVNIFGSIEYEADSTATNDLIMSLGFTKNKVENVFKLEDDLDEGSVFELGDYQISQAIFYDLLNTLKAYKASMSFKFERQKVANLLESSPQMLDEIRSAKTKRKLKPEKIVKTRIQNFQNIEDLLTSPKFYTNLYKSLINSRNCL